MKRLIYPNQQQTDNNTTESKKLISTKDDSSTLKLLLKPNSHVSVLKQEQHIERERSEAAMIVIRNSQKDSKNNRRDS